MAEKKLWKRRAEVGVDGKNPEDFGHTRLAFNEICGKKNLAILSKQHGDKCVKHPTWW